MRYYGWAPYVPVAERRAKALKQLEKMRKKGVNVQPVQLSGRKIAASFWGKGWCDHIESFGDYANRLPRGRSYVRNGSVCHLEIDSGKINAIVSGSELYNVSITITPLTKAKWAAVKRSCAGRIGSLIDLLRGRLDHSVMEVVTDRKQGLFPLPGEMKFACDCPDWAGMCKHVAAALYGIGARLDDSPEMLFVLRGVDHAELVDVSAAIGDAARPGTSRRRIAATGIADVFGIELAEADVAAPAVTVVPSFKKSKAEKTAATARAKNGSSKAPRDLRADVASIKAQIRTKGDAFPEPLTGDAIYAWRSALGETQSVFAARLGMTAASVSQWEKKGKATIGMQERTMTALRKAWRSTRKGRELGK